MSIACLDYFARVDPHARQYSLVCQSLLGVALAHLERTELQTRDLRKQASFQLFGLVTSDSARMGSVEGPVRPAPTPSSQEMQDGTASHVDWTMYEEDFFSMPQDNDAGLQNFLQPGPSRFGGTSMDIPLFPMDDGLATLLNDGEGDVF